MGSDFSERKRLTFEQAEGNEPIPTQLAIGEITPKLRAMLWHVVYQSFSTSMVRINYSKNIQIGSPWVEIVRDLHVTKHHGMSDEFSYDFYDWLEELKVYFTKGNHVKLFGLIEFIIRNKNAPYNLNEEINDVLIECKSPYRVFDGDTIIPISSEEEGDMLKQTFVDLSMTEYNGARSHLKKSVENLNTGNFSDSIRESIHAVESISRVLAPTAKTLEPALKELESTRGIHPSLKQGFSKLYGYTNDEKGIRHALIDEGYANVDEADALYMLGACAAFVSYLLRKRVLTPPL